ncbi:MAG TPA: MFS transporter [Candidatus Limnocylindrales bacterium]|nr:MFS transporter [Candidatus Limnocylindrales bacterium]
MRPPSPVQPPVIPLRRPTRRGLSADGHVPPGVLLGTLAALVVVVVANNSMGALAQPEIQRDFGVGPADVGWVVFGFAGSFAVATAVWGALGRRFGVGRSLATAIGLLSVASVAAALAPDLPTLIGARVLQGAGAGAIPTLGTALVGARFEGPRRAGALGIIVGSVGVGQAVGPVLGGALIDALGWHAVVGFSAIGAPSLLLVLRAQPAAGEPEARLDLVGAVLVAAAALSAVLLLNRLPVVGAVPLTLAGLLVLVLALVGLSWHVVMRAGRFLPREIVLDPVYRRLVALGAIGMSVFLGALVIMPIAVAEAQGRSGLELGLLLVPMAVTTAVLSPNNGRITRRFGRSSVVRFSLAALVAGALLLAVLGASAPGELIAAAMVPLGIGFSLLNAPLLDQLMQRFQGSLAPIAVGSYNLVYFLGGSLGAALATALVQQQVYLPLLSDAVGTGYPSALVLLATAPALTALLAGRSEPAAMVESETIRP